MLFGTASTGEAVEKITIGDRDLTVGILTWGAIIHDVRLSGVDRNLTLSADAMADYEGELLHHGSLIGPIANRISNARIKLDGMMYELERNQDGRVHLHSGSQATHRRNWMVADHSDNHVMLSCELPDGSCGLPGNRVVTVTYRVEAPATLVMEITGTTDATTAMNFASHPFWNLDGSETWAGHQVQIAADHYLPVDDFCCPTGEVADVTGTRFDLRQLRTVVPSEDQFDHNFCLSERNVPLRDVVTLKGASGVTMVMATTAPGLQVYDNENAIRLGRQAYEGLVFEAQHWPDAPNHVGFPTIIVTADESYTQTTTWRLST
ncbi:MAG: aldose epimerase family protein [Pseudomonadota bacterium]